MLEMKQGPIHLSYEPGSGSTNLCLSITSAVLSSNNKVIWLTRELPDGALSSQILGHLTKTQIEKLIILAFDEQLLERSRAISVIISRLNVDDLLIISDWCPNSGRAPVNDKLALKELLKENTEKKILFTSAAYEDASGKNRGWMPRGANSFNELSRIVFMTRHPLKDNYRIIDDEGSESLIQLTQNGFFPTN
ncbi:MAG: hypothetical protein HON26_02790 [Euryarchaeota archaeon]|jgi:hypothetical protein|nr:hypothetical protein [Euryarchaeota archaeon]